MSYETGVINSFRGEHYFLSNYSTTPFEWRRMSFHSGEQAFAYAKTFFALSEAGGVAYRGEILDVKTPGEAKKLGRECRINVDEWDKYKVMYMREIVHAKFMTGRDANGHGIVGPLCNTGARMLIEGNDWGDRFWGRVYEDNPHGGGRWVGQNVLGVILMEERGWWSRGDEGRP